ncbi:hypothetical protein M1271_04535 [Patescibacteria group bacterium]|nr:hypothetical protein [Patescibacteria group bacterium]
MRKKKKQIRRFHRSSFFKVYLTLLSLLLLPLVFWAAQYPQLTSSQAKSKDLPKTLNTYSTSLLSTSKIGVFYLGASGGGETIAHAGPRVIKVIDPQNDSSLMNIVRDYKNSYPDGIVVMRVYEGDAPVYGVSNDPGESAQDFWNKLLGPATAKLSSADKQLITYLAGPNEYGNTPIINSQTTADWTAKFWEKLSEIMSQNGFKPDMGEIPVGNLGPDLLGPLVPALREIKQLGGVWSYHAYSLDYTTDVNQENWTSLRYRSFYDYFRQNAPDLSDMPMILTEGGVDKSGNGQTDGWNARGDASKFEDWLQWYDGQIKQDPYILGVTLFQIGNNSDWKSFNVDPIASWLSNYLGGQPANNPLPSSPPPPTNPPTQVVWQPTNIPPAPTNLPLPTSVLPSPTPQPQPVVSLPIQLSPPPQMIRPTTAPAATIPPQPSQTPTFTPSPIPTPAPIIDIGKTVKNTRMILFDIFSSLIKFTRVILP